MINNLKVGVLGSGDVATTLAGGFLKHGHEVTMGTRDAGKLAEWHSKNPQAGVGSFADAASFGELLVLAVKGAAAMNALRLAEPGNLVGKPLIDACNPIAEPPPVNGVLRFFTTLEESLMERLQREFPEVHFVKAFNSVGASLMVNPSLSGGPPTMFLCGNEPGAKAVVSEIIRQFGWEPEDMGKAEAARAIEPLCMLWCIPGFVRNEWRHAFKLLK